MQELNNTYHTPVLLSESIDGLNIRRGGVYVDVTFGGGGHSREILARIGTAGDGHLYSFDQDADAEQNIYLGRESAEGALATDEHFTFVRSNFRWLKNWMRYHGVKQIDGLLADLGVSSHHFDDATRGFSFRYDSPLDMRMNKRTGRTAEEIINTESEERLANIFYTYGESAASRKIARLIIAEREKRVIKTTQDLINTIKPAISAKAEKKELAKIFQALRIEVNNEMGALEQMLHSAGELLAKGGRLSIITYHSLEDRMVKRFLSEGESDPIFGGRESRYTLINRKPITPSEEEVERNPRARSAKLRIAEKR